MNILQHNKLAVYLLFVDWLKVMFGMLAAGEQDGKNVADRATLNCMLSTLDLRRMIR
jgi:hypothetical protein